jgi:hypothetical protein
MLLAEMLGGWIAGALVGGFCGSFIERRIETWHMHHAIMRELRRKDN